MPHRISEQSRSVGALSTGKTREIGLRWINPPSLLLSRCIYRILGTMQPFADVHHALTDDGAVVLSFLGVPWHQPVRLRSRFAPDATKDVVGTLAVWFSREDPADPTSVPHQVEEVSLCLAGGLTPTDLQRFPWSRWLSVADAIARAGDRISQDSWWSERGDDPDTAAGKIQKALIADLDIPIRRRRPGRKGHPPEFYEEVAKRYLELRVAGARNPTARIASERVYSRNTVAGWVKRARELGYLPPGRRGRAG